MTEELELDPGLYFVQLWGAQGGRGLWNGEFRTKGGKGAYVSVILLLSNKLRFFANVGRQGSDAQTKYNTIAPGGWNGGGDGGRDTEGDDGSGGGGGATDLRVGENRIENRILVAAGGSGSTGGGYGAPGGDSRCFTVNKLWDENAIEGSEDSCSKKLGYGEDGKEHGNTPSSGAGGGYYGGKAVAGGAGEDWPLVSYSGNSFVADELTLKKLGITLVSQVIQPGCNLFPSHNGTIEKGHEGNGYFNITSMPIFDMKMIGSSNCKRQILYSNLIIFHLISLL